jgi:mannose-6-phosphate isomerase-like protein (cupin superfamily)
MLIMSILSLAFFPISLERFMDKINLKQKLSLINDHWNPRIIGELNGQYLKLVKFKGPFTWHHHENEDEMFLVVKGRFRMEFRENGTDPSQPGRHREVWLEEGEFIIVPRGVEHRPVADEEAEVLLFEPASTLNTGNVQDEFTVRKLERL